jgi:hypothetical protein
VRCGEIEERVGRNNPGRINRAVALVIVSADMLEIHRRGDAGPLIDVAGIGRQVGIIGDAADVALEVPDINRVEVDQRGEQPDVGLGQVVAEQETAMGQVRLELVQRLEQRADRFLLGDLRDCEACLVDAIVEGVVDLPAGRCGMATGNPSRCIVR